MVYMWQQLCRSSCLGCGRIAEQHPPHPGQAPNRCPVRMVGAGRGGARSCHGPGVLGGWSPPRGGQQRLSFLSPIQARWRRVPSSFEAALQLTGPHRLCIHAVRTGSLYKQRVILKGSLLHWIIQTAQISTKNAQTYQQRATLPKFVWHPRLCLQDLQKTPAFDREYQSTADQDHKPQRRCGSFLSIFNMK